MAERTRTVAELLGYETEARLLIINADDFGMCHAENAATIVGLEQGAFCSSTIMVPCPWFEEAAAFARRTPDADLGVHITHTSEWDPLRWGPVCGRDAVPSLVDDEGYFYRDVESLYQHARANDIERETRAQIERALAADIDISHLDSHMGTVQLNLDYHALYVQLAAEYRLPIRMAPRAFMHEMGMSQIIELADQLGVLAPDYFWYGGPIEPRDTVHYWTSLLRNLKPGVNEIYVHAALDHPEMRALGDAWKQRFADYEFFTAPSTRELLQQLGITLVGYRALRTLQRRLRTC